MNFFDFILRTQKTLAPFFRPFTPFILFFMLCNDKININDFLERIS